MFNIGTTEILIIAAIALIFLGPEKFPTQAKVFLRLIRDFREHWDDAKRDILSEINPVKKEFRELRKFKPEELLDKLTGESADETTPAAPAVAEGQTNSSANSPGTVAGANGETVAFESTTPSPATEGRSEASQWERAEPELTPVAQTEEDEYRSASANYASRPQDGSD
jgi:sec-independent protein translocase protein TatB